MYKYDSYIYFKYGNKKCNPSFELLIFIPHLIKFKTIKFKTKFYYNSPFRYFKFLVNIITSPLNFYFAF